MSGPWLAGSLPPSETPDIYGVEGGEDPSGSDWGQGPDLKHNVSFKKRKFRIGFKPVVK